MRTVFMLAGFAAMFVIHTSGANAECDPGEKIVRFSHVVAAEGHPKGEAAAYLARRVNSELDGSLCMEVYPDTSRFEEDAALEALISGDLELAAPATGRFRAYSKALGLFDLPFLFRDEAALATFASGDQARELLATLEPHGLVGLDYWLAGFRQFSANRPLLTPADAEGLTFRVQESELYIRMMEALGATAKPLPLGQTREALESGEADGQDNTWSNIVTQGFYEVQDGVTVTNHQALVYVLVTSRRFLDGLEPELRGDFLEIIADTTREANAHFAEFEAQNRAEIERQGVEIRQLSEDERKQWQEATRPVWNLLVDSIDPEIMKEAQGSGL